MLTNPTIRLGRKSDARPIAELSRDFIEHGLKWNYDRARILKAIADPSMNVAVAHERGRLLGFGIMEYGDDAAHLVLLGVVPGLQGRGLGRRLVAWLEQCAVVAGIRVVRVEARLDNPRAIAFYRRQGYREIRRLGGYYDGVVDAVRMEKTLGVVTA